MIPLNGRTKGDLIGQFTCNMYNGASVVDYAIVSHDLHVSFHTYSSFLIDDPTEFSNHSCLSLHGVENRISSTSE